MEYREFLEHLHQFLADGHLKPIFELSRRALQGEEAYQQLYADIVLQSARFSMFEQQERTGGIDSRDARTERNQLLAALQGLLEQMTHCQLESWPQQRDELQALVKDYQQGKASLPTRQTQESLGTFYQYACDRVPQQRAFLHTQLQPPAPCHYFCLHGAEMQSHTGLFYRFFHEYLATPSDGRRASVQSILLNEAHDEQSYRTELVYKLFRQFMPQLRMARVEDLPLSKLAQQLMQEGIGTAVVHFKVRSTYWKPFTTRLMRWFMDEYCASAKLPSGSPRFYFFLSVIYAKGPERKESGGWLSRFRAKPAQQDPFQVIREALKDMSGFVLLKELTPVALSDIDLWLEDHIEEQPLKRKQLLERFFPDARERYDMAEVEVKLEQIIHEHNNGTL